MKIKLNTSLLTSAVKSTGADIKPRPIIPGNGNEIAPFSISSLNRNGSLRIDDKNGLSVN